MLPIALDAMGGDKAPGEIVAGARLATDERGIPVVLVGRAADLGDTHGLAVIDAAQSRMSEMTREVVSLKDILSNKQSRGASARLGWVSHRRSTPSRSMPTRSSTRADATFSMSHVAHTR